MYDQKKVKSLIEIREGGKFLRIFNVNQNCAEFLFIKVIALLHVYVLYRDHKTMRICRRSI